MKYPCFITLLAILTSSCATLNDSLQLGAGIGTLTGATATYVGERSAGRSPSLENVALGASIGMGLGLLASYFVHKDVEEKRSSYASDQTEMLFGDLPPSPFILPTPSKKKEGQR